MAKGKKGVSRDAVSRMTPSKIRFVLAFFVPTMCLHLWLNIYPIFSSLEKSLTNWDGFDANPLFVGIDNYKRILTDSVFWLALKNDFAIVFWKEIIMVTLALFFAVLATRGKISKTEKIAYRFMFYIPDVLSIIVITTCWTFVLNPRIGLLNSLLNAIHLESLIPVDGWLVQYPIPWIIIISSWCGIGLYMILFISAINNVPNDLYEAASIDGAGELRQFFSITVPQIWGQIRYTIVTIFFGTLAANMGLILPLTNGGPDNKSMVMSLYVYQKGMDNYHVGYANAAAVVFMVVSLALSLVFNGVLSKKEDDN